MKKSITIGTRASKLAMIQTNAVAEQLRQRWPGLEVLIEQIHTRGDLNTEAPLTQIGSDGVFVTEIERALHDRRIDVAVHSLKDLPTAQPDGLTIAVVGPREDVRDAMVSRASMQIDAQDFQEQLARIADPLRIGTCSLRRTAQIRRLSPDAHILPIRGNVDTRLRKLDAGDYDAIVLAAAGLQRLDLTAKLSGRISYFPIDAIMPAPGQGALAVETRDDSLMLDLVAPLINREAQAATSAERMFMRRLGAGCYLPVAAYAEIRYDMLTLSGLVISLDGRHHVRVQQRINWPAQTSLERAEQLGISLAEEALRQGADHIIRQLDADVPSGTSGRAGIQELAIKETAISGKRILVTRTGEQAGALSDKLRALGAIPIELPMIRVVPPDDWQPLDDALRRLGVESGQAYAWIVFTSANGVNHFFERLRASGDNAQVMRSIRKSRVAAIGAATQAALASYGITVDLVPGEFVAESLVDALVEDARQRDEKLAGKRVLLARAAEARNILPGTLRQAGAIVDDVAAYRTLPIAEINETSQEVLNMLQAGELDMLTFTSSSTVRNFVHWLGGVLGNSDDPGMAGYPGRPQGSPLPYTNNIDGHESDRVGATLAVALDATMNPDASPVLDASMNPYASPAPNATMTPDASPTLDATMTADVLPAVYIPTAPDAAIALIQRNPHLRIACIGPVTAQTARELGLRVDIEATESTIDGLIEAILGYKEQ